MALLLSNTMFTVWLRGRCFKQEFGYFFSNQSSAASLRWCSHGDGFLQHSQVYSTRQSNDICVACLLFVETQSCSDLGGRCTYQDAALYTTEGHTTPCSISELFMFNPQVLEVAEEVLEQDSPRRDRQNWDVTPMCPLRLSKSSKK
jgi:hypothetical protein